MATCLAGGNRVRVLCHTLPRPVRHQLRASHERMWEQSGGRTPRGRLRYVPETAEDRTRVALGRSAMGAPRDAR
jgi:hypothetical protein